MADRNLTSSNSVEVDLGTAGQAKFITIDGDDLGDAGDVLTSQGAGQLPVMAALAAGGGAAAVDFQRFNSSESWTKPTDTAFGTNSVVLVRVWGAGGSGGRDNADGGTGGGGGGYAERWMLLSELSSSETVTIGGGGASVNANTDGNAGGDSSFGSHVGATGGGGGFGRTSVTAHERGGDGGGPTVGGQALVNVDFSNTTKIFEGEGADTENLSISDGFPGHWWGGGGAGISNLDVEGEGGTSSYGGGGGGSADGTSQAGGLSLNGGNGGASGQGANGTAGTQPGGGGGGVDGAFSSGAGADGRVDVIVFGVPD